MVAFERNNAVDDPVLYADWAALRPWCQACGIGSREAVRLRWPGLSRHHVVKAGRSDEPTNLLMLCRRCHDLAEGLSVREHDVLLPTLRLGVCLTLKALRDPQEYDPERLARLLHRPLPPLLPVPRAIASEYHRRRPWEPFIISAEVTRDKGSEPGGGP